MNTSQSPASPTGALRRRADEHLHDAATSVAKLLGSLGLEYCMAELAFDLHQLILVVGRRCSISSD